MNSPSSPNRVINNQFRLKKKLSAGSYGVVFEAEDIIKNQMVAVKIEKKEKNSTLDREIHILTRLQGTQGVPKLIWSGTDNNSNVLVQQLLSKDIGAYLKEFRKFSLKTVLIITDYLLQVIRRIHNKSVVHRDLKPENIMYHSKQIYIVDFGISKLYRDNNLKHVPFKDGRSFVGTTRYAPIAAHKGYEIGRKDDLESIIYIDILMLKGSLPWQNMLGQNNKERQKQVGEKKIKMTPQEICIDLPIEFAKALEYIRSLQYQSDPDYDYLIQLFRKLAQSRKIDYDDVYDWTIQNNNPNSISQKQENQIIQVASLQQFEKTPFSKTNKCHSLKVPSTQDILQERKKSFQNISQIQLLKPDDLNKSIENTYQLSQMANECDSKQDYISQDDDAVDTLFTRYNHLKKQNIEIHHPQNEQKASSGFKNV
ncbi:unnamed protein product (macronuclear) [Paramecium tetraurelia]|uniref:Casein kinase I n=1 Tax=Paramecium tetraurelia TaxID=5888 RepID=A0DT01_PARTE|nr:uncharacterized protein GSPATT00019861001 [Paramecium tetraurelia]CAK86168.1 unnamed protein product [Paramecium tetraurelia]|eukprot:XP_001453565.1 hypothetical protein (macronuclear) [Paramecium tetraurelia strain d4-2]